LLKCSFVFAPMERTMTTEGFNSLGTFQAQVMDTLWDLGGANIVSVKRTSPK